MVCLTQPCLFKFYSEFSKSFLKILLTSYRLCAIIANASGCGAVGSALPWGGRGRTFKSCHSDQIKPKTVRFRLYFLHFRGKIERFPTTSAPPEIPKIFLTTYLTTVGAKATRLVVSAPVRSAHEKLNNSKDSRSYSLREPFSLFTTYQISICIFRKISLDDDIDSVFFNLRNTLIEPNAKIWYNKLTQVLILHSI